MRSLFYLRCLRLAYRGDRVHGCTRVERDDAIAVGGVEDIHNVIIGDGDEKGVEDIHNVIIGDGDEKALL